MFTFQRKITIPQKLGLTQLPPLFYFALLHKKVGLANQKACQAEVFLRKNGGWSISSTNLGAYIGVLFEQDFGPLKMENSCNLLYTSIL